MPDIKGQKKDITVVVTYEHNEKNPYAFLSSSNFPWKKFYEPYGKDHYLQGPELQKRSEPGHYDIKVYSTNNDSKYALVIGDLEVFNFKEIVNAMYLVPKIKKDFFNESPANFLFSIFGAAYVIAIFIIAFLFGFIFRFILKKLSRNQNRKAHKNITVKGRLLRLAIGAFLFIWAITTSWSPFLLFFAGFCLFETIFSWCGFYAMIGKNSCPIN